MSTQPATFIWTVDHVKSILHGQLESRENVVDKSGGWDHTKEMPWADLRPSNADDLRRDHLPWTTIIQGNGRNSRRYQGFATWYEAQEYIQTWARRRFRLAV